MAFERLFSSLLTFSTVLSYFWPHLGLYGAIFGLLWEQNGFNSVWFCGHFGPFLGRFAVTLESLRDHFRTASVSLMDCFGVVWNTFLCHFRRRLGKFSPKRAFFFFWVLCQQIVWRPNTQPCSEKDNRGYRLVNESGQMDPNSSRYGPFVLGAKKPFYIGIENLFRSYLFWIDTLQKKDLSINRVWLVEPQRDFWCFRHYWTQYLIFGPYFTLFRRHWCYFVPPFLFMWHRRHQDLINPMRAVFEANIGPVSGHFRVILASFLGHFGIVLGSLWDHFDISLTAFLPFLTLFVPHFRPFYGRFAVFLVMFWEVQCKNKQNDAREGKSMHFSAKFHQDYANLCKNKPLFAYKTPVLLENTVKIDVSTYERVQ